MRPGSAMNQKKMPEEQLEGEPPMAAVRYSLPRLLDEISKDRESIRAAGKLLDQEQIAALFSSHRRKGGHDGK